MKEQFSEKRYGCFRIGICSIFNPYLTFEFSDLANNIQKFNAKNVRFLANELCIDGRSKKKTNQLRKDIVEVLTTTTTEGSTDIKDCLSDCCPESNRLWTVDEFVAKYQ